MKNIRKKLILGLTVVSSMAITSCQEWLDVKPSNQTEASVLFKNESGFQETLSGVYSKLSMPSLYGKEMTYCTVDVLGQVWDDVNKYYYPYSNMMIYDFENSQVNSTISDIWSDMFNAIAQLNNMLSYIDENKNVFSSEENYAIIKGEALALRAYLHFDIYRLFAPYGEAAGDKKWLPYVDQFTYNISNSLSNKDFIERVYKDIEDALELLKEDYIYTGTEPEDTYFKNRNFHINYWATKGLEARVALYNGDKTRAYNAAKSVIDVQSDNMFPFVLEKDATSSESYLIDRTFSTEHLFAINVRKIGDYITLVFKDTYDSRRFLIREDPNDIYEGISEYRKQFFGTVDGTVNMFTKIAETGKNNKRLPLIRISEMYYIAAETATSIAESVGYLNTVRVHRGIPEDSNIATDITNEQLQEEIFKEYKKEFIGEGQIFFYHKRMNSESISTQPEEIKYVLPIPDVEIEYGSREDYYAEKDEE